MHNAVLERRRWGASYQVYVDCVMNAFELFNQLAQDPLHFVETKLNSINFVDLSICSLISPSLLITD